LTGVDIPIDADRMRRRPRSPDSEPDQDLLPEAELEVLAALQALGEAPTSEIRRWLEPFRPMSHASVSTLLNRLEGKALVRRRKAEIGKAFLFSPTGDPSATLGRAASRVLHRLFGNDSASLVASLFGRHEPSLEEIGRVKRLVDELYGEKKRELAQ
jgi:predicted transcriptional regulator